MNKLSQFFSVFVNSFAWQTFILALLNVFLGSGFVFNAYSVIQCFIVALVISVLMFVTDMILSKGFKLKLSLLTVKHNRYFRSFCRGYGSRRSNIRLV